MLSGSGILRGGLGPNVSEDESASLRKYGKRGFPYLRILAVRLRPRRDLVPLSDLRAPSVASDPLYSLCAPPVAFFRQGQDLGTPSQTLPRGLFGKMVPKTSPSVKSRTLQKLLFRPDVCACARPYPEPLGGAAPRQAPFTLPPSPYNPGPPPLSSAPRR